MIVTAIGSVQGIVLRELWDIKVITTVLCSTAKKNLNMHKWPKKEEQILKRVKKNK